MIKPMVLYFLNKKTVRYFSSVLKKHPLLFFSGVLCLLSFLLFASLHAQTELSSNRPASLPDSPASITKSNLVTVASFNVENYTTMPRRINGRLRSAGKPEGEKVAVSKVLNGINPDIIGFMEIGDTGQFMDLQHHLQDKGLNYPYSEYLQGFDPVRHVALLSRFPIIARNSLGTIPLQVNGETLHSPRGILDVTIQLPSDYQLRLLCLHLKSKVNDANYDSSALREAEAKKIRSYVYSILTKNPETHLLVMGDFNDTKNSPTIFQILGKPDWQDSLEALSLTDDRGDYWTEFWEYPDVYSRIDYMMVSKSLKPSILLNHSGIARPSFWKEASDHCALFTTIDTEHKN